MPKISVIIPVYNGEDFVERCLNSVLKQTFSDYEIIIVNDGSTDNSKKICEEFAYENSNIRVFNKEKNCGHAPARNTGIDLAFESDSEWITFIDCDDWIDEHFLEYLYNAATEKNVDISLCDFIRSVSENDVDTDIRYEPVLYSPEDFWCENRITATIPCAKLFKKTIFNSVRWPNRVHDDEFLTYKLLFQYNQIAVLKSKMYCYYYNENSVMVSTCSPKRIDSIYAVKERREYFRENNFKKAAELDDKLYLPALYDFALFLSKMKKDYKKQYRFLLKELRRELRQNGEKYGFTKEKNEYLYIFAFPGYKVKYIIKKGLNKIFK